MAILWRVLPKNQKSFFLNKSSCRYKNRQGHFLRDIKIGIVNSCSLLKSDTKSARSFFARYKNRHSQFLLFIKIGHKIGKVILRDIKIGIVNFLLFIKSDTNR